MTVALKRLANLIAVGPLDAIVLSLVCIFVGGALLLPHETFAGRPAFRGLAAVADENQWGVVFVVLGLAKLTVAAASAWRVRSYLALTSGGIWIYWTGAAITNSFEGVLWSIGAAMVVGEMLVFYRLRAAQ